MLADLFASLAHDLRSPLGVITEALHQVHTDFDAQLTDEHRVLVKLADRGVRRVGRIADMVSLASALSSASFEVRPRALDLIELVRAAVETAASIEPRREVVVARELPAEPCPVLADPERLSFAISELVINGVRHARRKVRVQLERTPDAVRVAIEDDGKGVPEEQRGILFQRFRRRPTRTGLGMGLSIAHDLIEAHGGTLVLASSTLPPGCPGTTGARFVLSLRAPSGA